MSDPNLSPRGDNPLPRGGTGTERPGRPPAGLGAYSTPDLLAELTRRLDAVRARADEVPEPWPAQDQDQAATPAGPGCAATASVLVVLAATAVFYVLLSWLLG